MWRSNGDDEGVEVDVISLDDYIAKHVSGPIRLVKLDVEGMEVAALAGLAKTLASGRPDAVMIEIADPLIRDPEPVLAPLRDVGYQLRRIGLFGGLRRLEEIAIAPKLVGLYYVLAVRPGRGFRIGLR
jgi:hypothetical protein